MLEAYNSIFEEIERIVEKGEIAQLRERQVDLQRVYTIIERYSELDKINEDTLYKYYKPAINHKNKAPFKDFNQQHRDAYLRLKLRGEPQKDLRQMGVFSKLAELSIEREVPRPIVLSKEEQD